jgi:hypothetical protein
MVFATRSGLDDLMAGASKLGDTLGVCAIGG